MITRIRAGETMVISTALKAISIDKKTLDKWDKGGYALLKDGKDGEGGFYVARGRKYDYIMRGGVSIKFYDKNNKKINCCECGSDQDPVFDRTVPMGYYCPDCGGDK